MPLATLPVAPPLLRRHRSAPTKPAATGAPDNDVVFDALPWLGLHLFDLKSFAADRNIVGCQSAPLPETSPRGEDVPDDIAVPLYVGAITKRVALQVQCRESRAVASRRLRRAALCFLGRRQRRRARGAAICVQRHIRGFLQRLRMPQVGCTLLASRAAAYTKRERERARTFVAQHWNSADSRMALSALSQRIPECERSATLKRLLELEYKRSRLVGSGVVKDYVSSFRSDMLCRTAFGEDICVPPVLLFGPPGSGKRLVANLLYEEMCALKVCPGNFTEVRTAAELRETFSKAGPGKIGQCVYVSDMYDKELDWNVTLKRAFKASPTTCFMFGLNDQFAMKDIQGCIVKTEPMRLELPPFKAEELALITERSLSERGYVLAGGLSTEMLLSVINNQWSSADLARLNAHLAVIMMQRAIQNKSKRQPLRLTGIGNPAVMLPEDFGISELAQLDLERQRAKVMQELECMPGMTGAKTFLNDIVKRVEYVKAGGSPSVLEGCLNLVLTGNPGVGKTTFARLLFRTLRAHGVLKRDAFVEMNALQLKGKHCGHTAPQVIKTFRSALGGAIFLDEAYALCSPKGGKDTFGDEAVRTLLTEIENHRSEVLVIIAGYKEKMGHLLAQDPGLSRRFPLRLDLPDYTSEELANIVVKVARERFGLSLEEGLVPRIQRHIEEEHRAEIRTHNASLAVRLVERAVEQMTGRLIASGRVPVAAPWAEGAMLIAADFSIQSHEEAQSAERLQQRAVQVELDTLVGMSEAKEHLRKLGKKIEFVRLGGSPKILDACMNLVLTGNPGTGKTTLARLLVRFLKAHGVLKKDAFIERNALELKGEYCGQTAPRIKEIFEMAVGGCLFLDEAYGLANGDKFSNEAIRMLLTEVENHRSDVLVVLAGYEGKMNEFMKADLGLARRFPTILKLPDYSASDISRIAESYATHRMGVPLEVGVADRLADWLAPNMDRLQASSHNGGLAVSLTEQALARMADRVICALADGDLPGTVKEQRLLLSDFELR